MKMTNPPNPEEPFRWDCRGVLLVAGSLIFLIISIAIAGRAWWIAIFECVFLVAWLGGVVGIGRLVSKLINRAPFPSSGEPQEVNKALVLVTCAALGIGATSLITLGLGLPGWLNQAWAIGLMAAGWVVLLVLLHSRQKKKRIRTWMRQRAGWIWIWILMTPLAAILLVATLVPPGLLWGDEPNGYDVVEYHLQVPREWYEAGRIMPLDHNVFSYFPFNVEMQYLLAMHLRGGPWVAMYLAQFIHAMLCVLTVAAVYAIAGGGVRGTIAGALAAATPWIAMLAPVAYDEGGELLFGALAVGWALRARNNKDWLIAGIMAGLAAGTKLPIAPLMFVGIPLIIAATGGSIRGLAIYLATGLLVVSPWLIRNWIWIGNPVYPEMMDWLGRGHFSAVQVQRWREAYWPEARYRSPSGRFLALWQQVIWDWRYAWAIFPLAVVGGLMSSSQRAIRLLLLILFQLIVWMIFTHVQSRFMVIAIPMAALLAVEFPNRHWLAACALAAIGTAGFSTVAILTKMRPVLDQRSADFLGTLRFYDLSGFDVSKLPPDADLDVVGDASAFWYQMPMQKLHYKTVFDVDTSDPSKSIIDDWRAGMPAQAEVYVDTGELARFARTYYGIPPLTAAATEPDSGLHRLP
jgi:hypothetical protein